MEKQEINISVDLEQVVAAHSDITRNISLEDKFMINGREYVKGLVLGGIKRSVTTS